MAAEEIIDRTESAEIRELVELSTLYDCYGTLLNERKKQIYEDYILNNYSLGEIAESVGISRQGVRDVIVRCSRQLRGYEEKLHIAERSKNIAIKLDELKAHMDIKGSNDILTERLLEDIYEILN